MSDVQDPAASANFVLTPRKRLPTPSQLEQYRQSLRLATELRESRPSPTPPDIKVLLLEDNPADADLVKEYLEEAGMVCTAHFERLSTALSYVEVNAVDVILSDLSLPDAQGLEAVLALRKHCPEAAIVVLSGDHDEATAMRAVQLGAQDYLIKGIANLPHLHRTIHYAMEREAAERELAEIAYYDQLTGLVNRPAFMDKLTSVKARADRLGSSFALMFIDLNGFKKVNDVLGHGAGDLLLQGVAKRLSTQVRLYDTVCRWGGDEFIILLEELQDADIEAVSERLLAGFSSPFEIDGTKVVVTFSIGVAEYPKDHTDLAGMIKVADRKMYQAKEKSRGRK